VQVRTGRITGFEALLRWRHPELNIVPPAHFIPLAEETGLIVPIAEWVLREACTQACAWQRQGLPPLRVAVNVSARQFVDEDLLPSIDRVLQETGLDPALLELELTESTVMHNPDKARLLLGAIKAMGVSVAIDDFGIGYSSLSHLKQFPFDTIKIDRSFIKDIPGDAADAAITHAIIAMGKSLNIMVVAEGVETAEQWRFLRERGCDEIQGYYCSEPIGAEQFALLARSNTPHLTAADDRVANQAAY
jgi:EAL domain-containing protein (putative c-di-GMP-specific phosphodiesterase class I)